MNNFVEMIDNRLDNFMSIFDVSGPGGALMHIDLLETIAYIAIFSATIGFYLLIKGTYSVNHSSDLPIK